MCAENGDAGSGAGDSCAGTSSVWKRTMERRRESAPPPPQPWRRAGLPEVRLRRGEVDEEPPRREQQGEVQELVQVALRRERHHHMATPESDSIAVVRFRLGIREDSGICGYIDQFGEEIA